MNLFGQTVDNNALQISLYETPGSVSALDELALLGLRIEEIDAEILRLKDHEDFLQRLAQLEKYLQSPDPASEYGKYDAAFQALTKTKTRLDYVLANRSPFRDVLSFLGLIDTVQELEDQIERYSWIAEQLQKKLNLTRCISLQDEYKKLDAYLDKLIAKGFAPSTVSTQIRNLKLERAEYFQRLLQNEARSRDGSRSDAVPTLTLLEAEEASDPASLISEATRSYATAPPNLEISQDHSAKSHSDRTFLPAPEIDTLSFVPMTAEKRQTLFTQVNCWSALNEDLRFAVDSVVIVSPYLTMSRGWWFFKRFQKLLRNKISVTVVTLPSDEHGETMIGPSKAVIEKLENIGVRVVTASKIHQKLLIIDSKISWEGSLNWLSHKDTAEHVRRIEDASMVAEAEESLNAYLIPEPKDSDNQLQENSDDQPTIG